MFNNVRAAAAGCALSLLFVIACALAPRPAQAVPLFAQRYNLKCEACHSVLPELNAFGNAFRNRGYRIDGAPKHGTTLVALREQIGYTRDPGNGDTRRTVPAGAALVAAEVGQVEAFVHESLGSGGGPSSLFLGYLAYGDARSHIVYRAGLFELPLVHSAAQRNDTLTTYGYEGTLVGLNDLSLATPRWGFEAEGNVGVTRVAAHVAIANSGGSAYGGKPVSTGRDESFAWPELGLYARIPIMNHVGLGFDAITGSRKIALTNRAPFDDAYQRGGVSLDASHGRLELLAEQFYGRDANGDGAGSLINSFGGYARLRWRLGSHAFVGIREDASAAPTETRSLLWFAETHITPHARILIQQRRPIPGGPTTLEGALTVAAPWPKGK